MSQLSGPLKAFIISCIAFVTIYFGFSKIAPEVRNPEKSVDSQKIENTSKANEIKWIDSLSDSNKSKYVLLKQQYENAVNDSLKISLLQQISGFWYQEGKVGLAADYAKDVASLLKNGEAWTLAATNYVLAIKQTTGTEEEEKGWLQNARAAFDQALATDTSNITYQLNIALMKVEFPEGGPMEGILALRALNEKHPDHPVILYHLARLAIETNQWDRAKERLNHLITKNPDFSRAYCLLVKIAEHEKDNQALKIYQEKCKDE